MTEKSLERLLVRAVRDQGGMALKFVLHRHEQLRALGFRVYVIDGKEQIGQMITDLKGVSL